MKKTLLLSTLCFALIAVLVLSLALLTGAAESTITVTDGGNTLAYALNNVTDGGTIVIEGTYTIPADFNWTAHNKTVTITGDVLDFTNFGADGHFNINDNVTFSDIELKFATIDWNADNNEDAAAKSSSDFKRTNIYANGYRLTIDSTVTFTAGATYNTNVCLFGGSKGGTVNGNTNLTVLAGWYTYIFAGGHGGTINGSTYVTVGGTVNSSAVISNHDSNYNVYGGGWDDNITGSTYVTVKDSAKMIYVKGGSHGGSSKIGGSSNAIIEGGTIMSVYGGNQSVNTGTSANVLMTGGTVDQIFGAGAGASFGTAAKPVSVNVQVLGGTITRRIYGGCYNNFTSGGILQIFQGNLGTWDTSYQVYGDITLIISDKCNISYSYSDGLTTADKGLYAGSRLSTYKNTGAIPANENTTIYFLNTYQGGKLKAQDSTMQSIMSSVSAAANEIHTLTYSANGAVITQSCNGSGHSDDASADTVANTAHTFATATLQTSYDAHYTGSAIENVEIVYSGNWMLDPLSAITYTNNVNVGTATASASCNGVTATLEFDISKQTQSAPYNSLFTVINESIKGKADGAIKGLTAAMEYSTDGVTYTAATGDLSALAGGTYYVRYAETDIYSASKSITLTLSYDKVLTVTFKLDNRTHKTVTVDYGATLTDIPTIPSKTGFTKTAPKWMVGNADADFTNIQTDLTVTAKYTLDVYDVTFVIDGVVVTTIQVKYGSAITGVPAIPEKVGYNKTPATWDKDLTTIKSDMTVTAVYTKNLPGAATDATQKDEGAALGDGWKEQVLTEEDEAALDLGDSIKVFVQTDDATLTAAQQSALDAVLNGYVAEHYLQLSFFKKVGNASEAQIDTLDSELTVTLKIPAEILSKERQYKLFAICDGVATEVDADYNAEAGTMTVKVKDFSTVYAFSYQEPLGEVTPTGGNSTVVIIVIAAVVVVGGGVAAGIVVAKKKKKA